MAEGARLESVYTATYRGFESPPHRHIRDESLYESTGSFLLYSPQGGMRTPDRGSITGAASWTDRARSKRAAPQGRAKRVNPPLTAIFEMRACTQVRAFFFYILCRGGGGAPREKPIPKLILLHPLILFAEVVHQRPDGGQQPAP